MPATSSAPQPDPVFSNERLARVYDPLDPDRSDLDAYAAMVEEFGARRVLDIGCGTGTFATLLASRGVEVTGVDPATASLEVARRKAHADQVRWVDGIASDVAADPSQHGRHDMATMTANVAQVFVDDASWLDTLRAARTCLRPGGRLVFETRVVERQAWRDWTREASWHVEDVSDEGEVEDWVDVTGVEQLTGGGVVVTFVSPTVFRRDGVRIDSTSTLRFRTREELDESLSRCGFQVDEVRDAPDRPGREWVYVATAVGDA